MTAFLYLACSLGMAAPPSQPPAAAEAEGAGAEIVVTGERAERRLLDTPSSVAVFTADRLESLAGVERVDDLLSDIPNVQIGSGGEGPTIRGQDTTGVLRDLPAFLGGTRPRTTLQVDGRPAGFNEFVFGAAPLWDVERVEVFRSPQSTTQGRNSIAGAIFVETNDPTYAWEGRGRILVGNEDVLQGSALLSGPIVADQLAFRIAGDLRGARASSRIADFVPDADPNEESHALVRAKVLLEPRGLPDARLELTYSHLETRAPQIEGVKAPFERRRDPSPIYGSFLTNIDSGTAVLTWQLASDLRWATTLSYGDALIRRLVRPGVGRARTRTNDYSGETVLRWSPSEALSALAGLHLLDTRLRQEIDLAALIGTGAFKDDQASFGLFGEVALRPVPRIEVTAGARYQRDGQRRVGSIGDARGRFAIDFEETFEAWLPKLALTYAAAEDLRVGAIVQRAYNPGGATIRADTGATDTFGAETLWAYELFARASLMNGRLTARANLFYNDIENAQRPQVRTVFFPDGTGVLVTDIDNAPAAETYGMEADLTWRPSRRFSLEAGLGLLRTQTLDTVDPVDPIRGKEFQRAPHLTASASFDWRPIDPLRLSLQLRHNRGYFSDDQNSPDRRVGAATVLNARAAWDMGALTLFAYARNITDEFYLTYLFSRTSGTAGDPRQIGLGIETRF